MKKLITTISLVAMLTIGAFAQNNRNIQDAVRSLNSKLDDIEQSFQNQMRSNSVPQGQIDVLRDDVNDLRSAVRDLQNNLDRHRDNRNDARKVVESAQRLNDVMGDIASNRQMERDWQTAHDQVDRIAREYGVVVNSWNGTSSNANPAYSSGNGGYNSNGGYSNDDNSRPAARPAPQRMPPVRDNGGPATVSVGLSGTYQIDRQASENIDDIVRSANISEDQQSDLRDKLEAPDQIAIEIRGTQVTLATTKGNPVTFTADGRDKTQDSNGRTIKLRATMSGDTLTVSSLGGETDFNITFTSISGGRAMKVSRRITTDYLKQTVFAESLYNKSDSVAHLDLGGGAVPVSNSGSGSTSTNTTTTSADPNSNRGYSDNDQSTTISNGGSNGGGYNNTGGNNNRGNTGNNNPSGNRGYNGGYNNRAPQVTTRTGDFVVPNGVTLSGRLESLVTTKVSQNGDRFKLTVQSPSEYRGAVIDGYLSNVERSGKVSGQSNVTFNFEKITLPDGKTYDFAGQVMSVTDASGRVVKVDNEGTVQGDNQTNQTAKRGAAGGGLGALIGLIAGGGKGAAIGAIIGATGGASTVLATGREDIDLQAGSTISVQSTSPNQNYPR
ncbi:MAG: hypothetical protein ACJ73D_02055 [Pyrinomonadaceae bacterium]